MKEKNAQKNDFIMDTCVARRLLGNQNYLSPLKFRTDCDWKSSRILVPEQVVYELGKQGVSLGELASVVRKSLGPKVYKTHSSQEEISISEILLSGLSTLHAPDHFVLSSAVYNRAILLTCDKNLVYAAKQCEHLAINPDTICTNDFNIEQNWGLAA
mgnify:CR=1 FL=1|tara:strand:- start:1563 stop:2033 length:471 start_codon:yes stop_codon:yes gene_type:complete